MALAGQGYRFNQYSGPVVPWTSPPQTFNADPNAAVPYGWEARADSSGRTYYFDHNTGTTTWTRPMYSQMPSQSNWTSQAAMAPRGDARTSLLPGWERRVDGSGRLYYVDHNTKMATWEPPPSIPAPATISQANPGPHTTLEMDSIMVTGDQSIEPVLAEPHSVDAPESTGNAASNEPAEHDLRTNDTTEPGTASLTEAESSERRMP